MSSRCGFSPPIAAPEWNCCAFSPGLWRANSITFYNTLKDCQIKLSSSQRESCSWRDVDMVRFRQPVNVMSRKNVSRCFASGNGIGGDADMEIMEGDVVEYPLYSVSASSPGEEDRDGRRKGVGVIVDLSNDAEVVFCHIEPLCQEDPASKEWIEDEFQPKVIVPVGEVRILDAWYSQRMVPDRISNPHGEHAESLWTID